MKSLLDEIKDELERCGAGYDALGPCDSIAVSLWGNRYYAGDDGHSSRIDPHKTLAALKSLPDGAGWEASWEAICEIEE